MLKIQNLGSYSNWIIIKMFDVLGFDKLARW
jgi:hypothetical protein